MNYRIVTFAILSVFVLNLSGSTLADTTNKRSSAGQLVAMLPASDGVVTLNVRRFFGEAVPRLLANNQSVFGTVNRKIEEFQGKTGIDIRKFDDVAIGVTTRQIAAKKYEIDPVVIARGQTATVSLIAKAKEGSAGKFREEKVGDRVMFIFDAQTVAKMAPTAKTAGRMSEVAVAALDDRTLAFGDVARVRQTLEAKTKVGLDLIAMLEKDPAAVASFAGKTPAGLKNLLPLENDAFGKNIDSIRYVYGSADVAAEAATVRVTARTALDTQANELHQTLDGLRTLGKALLSGAKGDDKQLYTRLLEAARFTVKANEVTFDLTVPQSDIDQLAGLMK